MAFHAPIALFSLLTVWLLLVAGGYAAMFWALHVRPVEDAIVLSGSSLVTLGFATSGSFPVEMLAFTEAGLGLLLLAILITYLPSLYQAFSRREEGVAKLEVRTRSASPAGVLELAWAVGKLETLRDVWPAWEDWFVAVDESHTAFPSLAFFRSTHPDQSWVTAAGTMLDAASLYVSSVNVPRTPEAEYLIRSGYLCLTHIAAFFHLPVDLDPLPTDPISITREEYDEAWERLDAAGIPMKPDRDQGWRDYAGWRVNYDKALVGLARITMSPVSEWSSDRYDDVHYIPPAFPWLRRNRVGA
jgi:fumarate reductase subunit D